MMLTTYSELTQVCLLSTGLSLVYLVLGTSSLLGLLPGVLH